MSDLLKGARRQGKSAAMMAMIEYARFSGKTCAVMTTDHAATANRISKRFPGVLCEVRGDALIPHFPKKGRDNAE